MYKETLIEFKAYNVASELPVNLNTNSLLLVNKGTAICYINGFPLAANEVWGDSRNANEVITGKFNISFDTTGTPLLHVQLTRYK